MFIRKLIRDKKGATAIEYGLIAALIAVAAITAIQAWAVSSSNLNTVSRREGLARHDETLTKGGGSNSAALFVCPRFDAAAAAERRRTCGTTSANDATGA